MFERRSVPGAPHVPRAHGMARGVTPRANAAVRRPVWIALVIATAAAALLLSVAAHQVPYFAVDVRVTQAVQATDMGALVPPMRALNTLGFPPLVGIAYSAGLIALFLLGRRWEATAGSFGLLGAVGINNGVKWLVDRPRPDVDLVHVERHIVNPSYPAGHVLNFTVFAGFLGYLVYLRTPRSWRRGLMLAVVFAAIALMGLARVDSGEHWPSDVLGGYLLGTSWLGVTVAVYHWGLRRRFFARRLLRARPAGPALLALLLVGSGTLLAGASHAASEPFDSLATTTGVPWNPPQPLARRTAWEQVAVLPGRVLSLPLVGLGWAAEKAFYQLEQRPRFANMLAPHPGARVPPVRLRTARLGDRTGLGGAVELHADLLRGAYVNRLALEHAATLHHYERTLVTWTGRPLSLEAAAEWRPQELFNGLGNDSPSGLVSDYATHIEFARAVLGWPSNRERDPSRGHSEVLAWGGPRSQVTRTGRESGVASYETVFPALGAATLDRTVEHLVYGASLATDQRLGAPHWSRGWRALVSAERFGPPLHALALHSGHLDGTAFTRYRAEAEAGLSFMRDPRTLRFLVRVSDQVAGAGRDRLLPSDYSTLGGQAGLAGFAPGRFHDMDLLLTRLDYVFPLQRSFELDLHSEWGAVYPDLWNDATFRTLHHSLGVSLRARTARAPSAAIGLDWSREGMRMSLSLGGGS